MADLIISKIPEGEFPGIIEKLVAINTLVDPYYRNLTAKERIGLRSMAEGREGYARLVGSIATANPDDLSKRDDPSQLDDKLLYHKNLEASRQQVLKLLEKLEETQQANATDIMTLVDSYVNALQNNRSRNSSLDKAMQEVDDYNKRFGAKGDDTTDTPAVTVTS